MIGVRRNCRRRVDVEHLDRLVAAGANPNSALASLREELRRRRRGRQHLIDLARVGHEIEHRRVLLVVPQLP